MTPFFSLGSVAPFSEAEVGGLRSLVSPTGNVLVHPNTYFQGDARQQTSGDAAFFDMASGNHGVFGANLSRAQAWADRASGFVSTVDPVGGATDSVIRIPGLNFDYLGGEALLVMWRGQVTPEGGDVTLMGTSFGASQSGVRLRAKTAGTFDFALYQAGGANAFSSATSNDVAGRPFVTGQTHGFAMFVAGATKKYAIWVDGLINISETTFGAGIDVDTKTTNTWNIGAGSASPGGTEGIATKTAALLIMRWGAEDIKPSVSVITTLVNQWNYNSSRTVLPGAI